MTRLLVDLALLVAIVGMLGVAVGLCWIQEGPPRWWRERR